MLLMPLNSTKIPESSIIFSMTGFIFFSSLVLVDLLISIEDNVVVTKLEASNVL